MKVHGLHHNIQIPDDGLYDFLHSLKTLQHRVFNKAYPWAKNMVKYKLGDKKA